jgi:hypothetical protein
MHVLRKTDVISLCAHVPLCIQTCVPCMLKDLLFVFAAASSSPFAGIMMSELQELQEAKQELNRCNKNLRALMQSHLPDSKEVCQAELGVAKAELGVAKAELGVAKAKLQVAEGKPESPERHSEIAKAEGQVAKAEWDIAIAVYNAEAKKPNPERLEILQGQIQDKKEIYQRLQGQLSSFDFCTRPV